MIDRARWERYATDPAAFRRDLIVDADGEAVRLGDRLDAWQRADFAALDRGWLRCVGREAKGNRPVLSRAYLERPRGHSKTSDLAVMAIWALAFSPRVVTGVAAAADRDQARLLRDAILRLVRLNPWLADLLDVQNYVVRNVADGHPGRDSRLDILSSDAGSSFGLLVDFVVCDEVSNWQGDGELWHSLFSAVAKRKTAMLTVISNAGRNQHACWQWTVRELARQDKAWYFHSLDGPCASWISQAALDEQQRILPPAVFKRLWLNVWSTGGDALGAAKILAAVTQKGPMTGKESFYEFVGGLDLSTRRDRSAFVILAAESDSHQVRLAHCQAWAAGADGKIDLQLVREAVYRAHEKFRKLTVYFDPFQCELMAQELAQAGVRMKEMTFTGQNVSRMASSVLESFNGGNVELYDDRELIADLTRLSIVEKSFGWKLEASRTSAGHADRAIAFAIALPAAVELAGKPKARLIVAGPSASVREPNVIAWDGRQPMSEWVRSMGGFF